MTRFKSLWRIMACIFVGWSALAGPLAGQTIDDLFGDAIDQVEAIAGQFDVSNNGQPEKKNPPAEGDDVENEDKEPKAKPSLSDRFEKFAKEIEREMERRELEGNKNLKIVRNLQNEQRKLYKEHHAEIKRLAEEKKSRAIRAEITAKLKKKFLAGARLNELERRAVILMANSHNGRSRNNDLMTKLHRYTRDLTAKERTEFHRDSKTQQRYNELMQKVMASQHRHFNQRGFVDLTDGLVDEFEIGTARYPDHPGSQNGLIRDARSALNKLLRLTWQGNQIAVDQRHWDRLFADRSPEDLAKDVDFLLEKNHVKMPKTDRHGMPFNRGTTQSNIAKLFDNLRQEVGHSGSSSSGGGNNLTVSFSGGTASSTLSIKDNSFRFEFRERSFPHRLLMVQQTGAKVGVTLYGDVVLRFNQNEDGSIRIVETMEDQLITRSAASLGKLYDNDPEFIESRLFPLLYHIGIIPPASRFDTTIVDRVVERLSLAMETKDADLAFQLIADLDADNFQIRQAATRRLEAKVEQYRELLVAAANDEDASFEKRSRIKFLLDKDSLTSAESDGLISTLKLLDNPQYLAIMMQQLGDDEVKPVAHRLGELTGEDYGTDVDAWRNWLSKTRARDALGIE